MKKIKTINMFEDCPCGCAHLELGHDAAVATGGTIIVEFDCRHGAVCSKREDGWDEYKNE